MTTVSRTTRLGLIGLIVSAVILALALLQHGLAAAAPTAPTAAGVTVQPTSGAQNANPGTSVTYTVRVTNTGSASDIITLTVTGQAWPTGIFTTPKTVIITNTTILIQRNPGDGRNVQVVVAIPAGVAGGDQDVTTFRARSQTDPSVSAIATLTTKARYRLYLPLALRD